MAFARVLALAASLGSQFTALKRAGVPAPPPLALILFRRNARDGLAASLLMLAASAVLAAG